MRHPLLAPLAAVAAGVFTARFADFSFTETWIGGALLAGLALVALRLPRTRAGLAAGCCGFFFAGLALSSIEAPVDGDRIDLAVARMELDLGQPVRLSGTVAEPPEVFEDADRFVLEAELLLADEPVSGRVRVTVNRPVEDPPLQLAFGQRIEFFGRLRELHNYQNPGAFDRVNYLHGRGIYMSATVRPYTPLLPLEGVRGSAMGRWLWNLRGKAHSRFDALTAELGSDRSVGAAVLKAMLLGDRSALERQTVLEFQRTGAYHALVVSGLHAGVVALSVFMMFRLLGGPRILEAVAAVGLVAGYAVFLEGSLSITRAVWMLGGYLIASHGLYRSRQALNVVAGVALGFLLADPDLLADAGFQLSFGSVALIAGVAVPILQATIEPFRRALVDIWNFDRDLHSGVDVLEWRVHVRNWLEPVAILLPFQRGVTTMAALGGLRVLCWAAALMAVSAVLAIGLAAPLAWHFQRIAGGGVAANLVVMPLLAFVIPAGFVALAGNSSMFMAAALGGAEMIGRAVAWCAATLPLDIRVPPPPGWLSGLAIVSVIGVGWALQRPKGPRVWVVGLALVCFALIVIHPVAPDFEPGRLELSLIDVGQGEALLLVAPDGRAILVDAGGVPDFGGLKRSTFDVGDAVVSPYLWSRSYRKLYALAVTHPDWDHYGGAFSILENFRVGALWLPAGIFGDEFEELVALARRRGTQVRYWRTGDSELLAGVFLEAIHTNAAAARNDLSLAFRVRYGEHDLLLTGDLEEAGEGRLAQQLSHSKGGILKVAHHGSRSSSHPPLLDRFRPALSLVSAGYDNLYGHPHDEALERLAAAGSHTLRTDQDGLVRVLTDGRRYEVRTFKRNQALLP